MNLIHEAYRPFKPMIVTYTQTYQLPHPHGISTLQANDCTTYTKINIILSTRDIDSTSPWSYLMLRSINHLLHTGYLTYKLVNVLYTQKYQVSHRHGILTQRTRDLTLHTEVPIFSSTRNILLTGPWLYHTHPHTNYLIHTGYRPFWHMIVPYKQKYKLFHPHGILTLQALDLKLHREKLNIWF